MKIKHILLSTAVLCGLFAAAEPSFGQGTAFTCQGRLNDGTSPATGNYDLLFTIYDLTNIPGTVIAGPITNAVTSVRNGLSTATLDFGAGVFIGADRWLEIGVRTNGGGGFATLSPRQKMTPAPYAITAVNLAGVVANNTFNSTDFATVGGGVNNASSGPDATAGGGSGNTSSGYGSTVGGGIANTSSGFDAAVGGGFGNNSSGQYATVGGGNVNTSSGYGATVGGGYDNTSSGFDSTVPGGFFNSAAGDLSFAAGTRAKANHQGSFVWADPQIADFASTATNQFNIRASGGIRVNDNTSLSFGAATRQMLNLSGTQYGIGVQTGSLYQRSDELKKTLGFAGHRETKETDVLLLKIQNPNAAGLKPATLGGTQNWGQAGRYYCDDVPLSSTNRALQGLGQFLEQIFEVPVIDQTGLTQLFNIDLRWDARHPSQREAIKQALLNRLGLELVPGRQRIEMLVVEKTP